MPASLGLITGSPEQRLRAVIELCNSSDWESLAFALIDGSPLVRQYTVSCWDPERAGIQALTGLAGDPDPSVRSAVAVALARSDDPQARGAIVALLDDGVERVRLAAVQALPFEGASDAVAELTPLLFDSSLFVIAAAAERLDQLQAWDQLSARQQEAFRRGRLFAAMAAQQPESLGAVQRLYRNLEHFENRLRVSPHQETGCPAGTQASLASTRSRLDELVLAGEVPKAVELMGPLQEMSRELEAIQQGYHACVAAPPLRFSIGRPELGDLGARVLVATAELTTTWEYGFGPLRAGFESLPREEDLWARSLVGVDVFLPGRPGGATAPTTEPSLAFLGRLLRDQLFRHDEVSSWNGGGLVRGRLPLSCPLGVLCRLSAEAHGMQTAGGVGDYPAFLVAPQRRLGGVLAFELDLESGLRGSASISSTHVRYRQEEYRPAGMDRFAGALVVDSSLQARLAVARNQYASTGPTGPASVDTDVPEIRDGTVLDGLVGIRLGDPGRNDILQFLILGGMALPLMDEEAFEVDPQLTMDLLLTLQNHEEHTAGRFLRLRIGGRRRLEASPRDFALQAWVESYLDFVYRGLDLPKSGIQIHIGLSYDLLDQLGPLGEQSALEISRIRGGVDLRLLLDGWIGLGIANWTMGTAQGRASHEISNSFLLSMFLPWGGYGFDLEEPVSW